MATNTKDSITFSDVSGLIFAATALIAGGAGLLASSTPILGVAAASSLLAAGIKLRQRTRDQIKQTRDSENYYLTELSFNYIDPEREIEPEREIDWLNHHRQELSPDLKDKIIKLGEALKNEREETAKKALDISENC